MKMETAQASVAIQRPGFLNGLSANLQISLSHALRDLWCHTSTALEGNTLSLGDTQFILEEGLTVSGKPLKDHNEIHGHARAIDLLYSMLGKETITDSDIFLLHQAIITERISDIYQPIGAWKAEANYTHYISQSGKPELREYPSHRATPRLMQQWLDRCNAFHSSLSQDEASRAYAELHLAFVTIHPFFDGNGRLARLVANLPVLKAGYPPIIVPKEDRFQYRETISRYQESIQNLAGLNDLDVLPAMDEFSALCTAYWSETMRLVDTARALQM